MNSPNAIALPSGLYPIDIDQDVGGPKRAVEIIKALDAFPHCVLSARSIGGCDAWALLAGPEASNRDQNIQLHTAIVKTLPESFRRHTTLKGQQNPGRLRYLGSDANVYVHPHPTTATPSIEMSSNHGVEPRDDSDTWKSSQEFLIAPKSFRDDSTRLAVGMCTKSSGRSYADGRPWSEWADICRRGGSSRPEHFSEQRWDSFYNLVSRFVTSLFPGHLSAVIETATGPSSNGNHNKNPGYPLCGARLRRLLPALKGCIIPRQLPRLHHPSSTRRAEA